MDKTPTRRPTSLLDARSASPSRIDRKGAGADGSGDDSPVQWTAHSVTALRYVPPLSQTHPARSDGEILQSLQARHVAVVREGKASGQVKRGREPEAAPDSAAKEMDPAQDPGVRLAPALGAAYHWPQEGSAWRRMEVIFGERDLGDTMQRAAALGDILRYACRNLGRRADRLALGVALGRRLQEAGVGPAAQARELREVLEAGRWQGSDLTQVRPTRLHATLGDLVRGMASTGTDSGDYERRLATFATGVYQARGGRGAIPMAAYRLVVALRHANEAVAQPAHLRVDLMRGLLAPVVDAATGAPTLLAPVTCASIVEGLAGGTVGDVLLHRLMTQELLGSSLALTPGQLAGCLGALASWGRPATDTAVCDFLADVQACPRPAAHKGAAALAVARIDRSGDYGFMGEGSGPGGLAMDLAATRQRVLGLVRPSARARWAEWLDEAAPAPQATSRTTTSAPSPAASNMPLQDD